jgi:hypothetical protein
VAKARGHDEVPRGLPERRTNHPAPKPLRRIPVQFRAESGSGEFQENQRVSAN